MRMRGYQQALGVHEPKNMKMWGCEGTNKRTEYMSLRIKGCEDIKLQASTHEPEDMGMSGWEDARIQASTQEPKNMRIWGWEDTNKSNISNM